MVKQRILVVDDDKEIVRLLRSYLEKAGFEVLVAYDGGTAVHTLRRDKPDLLVLDVMMPDLDGADIIYRLKNDSRLKHIAVVFHTATVREAELHAHGGIISGFPFLAKPATTDQMIEFIEKHLPK